MSSLRNRYAVISVAATEILFSLTFVALGLFLSQTLSHSPTFSEPSTGSDADLDSDLRRLALYLHILTYVCLLVMSGFGLQAAARERRKRVSLFFSMVLAQFFLSIGSGVFCLVLLFEPAPTGAHACSNLDRFSRMFCEHSGSARGLSTALYLQIWLIELIGLYFTLNYSQQLLDEEEEIAKETYHF